MYPKNLIFEKKNWPPPPSESAPEIHFMLKSRVRRRNFGQNIISRVGYEHSYSPLISNPRDYLLQNVSFGPKTKTRTKTKRLPKMMPFCPL